MNKIEVIPPGVDLSTFHPIPMHEAKEKLVSAAYRYDAVVRGAHRTVEGCGYVVASDEVVARSRSDAASLVPLDHRRLIQPIAR